MTSHSIPIHQSQPRKRRGTPVLSAAARLISALVLLPMLSASAQTRVAPTDQRSANVVIRVRTHAGPLPVMALVRISSTMTQINLTENTSNSGQVAFRIRPGRYTVDVSAPGFETTSEEFEIWEDRGSSTFTVELRPEGSSNSRPLTAPGKLVLAPKARKEMDRATAAIRSKDFSSAEASLGKVLKLAPGHPDAYYLLAVVQIQTGGRAAARENLKKALQLYPDHLPALISMSAILYEEKSYQAAIVNLDRVLQLNPDSWRAGEVLAACYLAEREFQKAKTGLLRAMESAKSEAPQLRYLLALSYRGLGEPEKARAQLQLFLASNPNHPTAGRARAALADLNAAEQPSPAVADAPGSAGPGGAKAAALRSAPEATIPMTSSAAPPPNPAKWPLTPIDAFVPRMASGVACALPEVLQAVGQNVMTLADNLEKVAAIETIEAVTMDADGNRHYGAPRRNRYVVSITEPRAGQIAVDESRQLIPSRDQPPAGVEIKGLFALAVIFHPFYAKDFEMRCEGQTEWHGQPVWSVYFKQRAELASRVRIYYADDRKFPVPLKGRAFVTASDFQIVRMETNLVAPISDLKLEHEHLVIEYEPAEFTSRKVTLWLPATGEFLTCLRGRVTHSRYRMNEYMLFNVDVGETVQKPRVADEPPPEKPPQQP